MFMTQLGALFPTVPVNFSYLIFWESPMMKTTKRKKMKKAENCVIIEGLRHTHMSVRVIHKIGDPKINLSHSPPNNILETTTAE